MIPIRLIGILFKTGTKLFEDRQQYKQAMSEAKLLHARKIQSGEIEYKEKIIETHNNGVKDEIVLFSRFYSFSYFGLGYFHRQSKCF